MHSAECHSSFAILILFSSVFWHEKLKFQGENASQSRSVAELMTLPRTSQSAGEVDTSSPFPSPLMFSLSGSQHL